jgi:hypothetical protein
VRFEVVMAMIMNISNFVDVMQDYVMSHPEDSVVEV